MRFWMIKQAAAIIFVSLLAAGCQEETKVLNSSNVLHIANEKDTREQIKISAEDSVKHAFPQIKEITAVEAEQHLFVAYQLVHFQRFRSEQIEDKVKAALEKQFPTYAIIVSGDLKLFWETEKLAQKQLSEEKLKEKILNLKKLKDEQT
jgi:predicted peroxiredoxin